MSTAHTSIVSVHSRRFPRIEWRNTTHVFMPNGNFLIVGSNNIEVGFYEYDPTDESLNLIDSISDFDHQLAQARTMRPDIQYTLRDGHFRPDMIVNILVIDNTLIIIYSHYILVYKIGSSAYGRSSLAKLIYFNGEGIIDESNILNVGKDIISIKYYTTSSKPRTMLVNTLTGAVEEYKAKIEIDLIHLTDEIIYYRTEKSPRAHSILYPHMNNSIYQINTGVVTDPSHRKKQSLFISNQEFMIFTSGRDYRFPVAPGTGYKNKLRVFDVASRRLKYKVNLGSADMLLIDATTFDDGSIVLYISIRQQQEYAIIVCNRNTVESLNKLSGESIVFNRYETIVQANGILYSN